MLAFKGLLRPYEYKDKGNKDFLPLVGYGVV